MYCKTIQDNSNTKKIVDMSVQLLNICNLKAKYMLCNRSKPSVYHSPFVMCHKSSFKYYKKNIFMQFDILVPNYSRSYFLRKSKFNLKLF